MIQRILAIIFCFLSLHSYTQKIGTPYLGESSDSTVRSHILTFLSDSTLELKSVPRHMSSNSKTILSYNKNSNGLIISGDTTINSEGQGFFPMVRSGFNLFVEGKALLDTIYHTVYVLYNDFKDGYDQLFIIDGKRYLLKTKLPNAYGLITGQTTMNKALQKRLKKLKPDTHLVKIYKGYEAYQRFGYNYVLGVIEISAKP